MKDHTLKITLHVPITICSELLIDEVGLQKYLESILNSRNGERLCFNGEIIRHALHKTIKALPRTLGITGESFLGHPPTPNMSGDHIDIEIDS